jgi:hypothetical protein
MKPRQLMPRKLPSCNRLMTQATPGGTRAPAASTPIPGGGRRYTTFTMPNNRLNGKDFVMGER